MKLKKECISLNPLEPVDCLSIDAGYRAELDERFSRFIHFCSKYKMKWTTSRKR